METLSGYERPGTPQCGGGTWQQGGRFCAGGSFCDHSGVRDHGCSLSGGGYAGSERAAGTDRGCL